MSQHRTTALRSFRSLLRLILQVDDSSRRDKFLEQARESFFQHKDEKDPEAIRALLNQVNSRIGFLRTIVPHSVGEGEGGTFIVKDGDLVRGESELSREKRTVRNWESPWKDPLALKRHRDLVKRQHFGRIPVTKEMF